jgi:hypothetical protein
MHWAVDDNAGIVFGAPGDFGCSRVAVNQRKRRLQRTSEGLFPKLIDDAGWARSVYWGIRSAGRSYRLMR